MISNTRIYPRREGVRMNPIWNASLGAASSIRGVCCIYPSGMLWHLLNLFILVWSLSWPCQIMRQITSRSRVAPVSKKLLNVFRQIIRNSWHSNTLTRCTYVSVMISGRRLLRLEKRSLKKELGSVFARMATSGARFALVISGSNYSLDQYSIVSI